MISLTGKIGSPYSPRSYLGIWFREIRSAVPSRVSSLLLYTQVDSDASSQVPLLPPTFRDRVHPRRRQLLMGQFRVEQTTQWRADSVHFRESAGTGIVVVLKMAQIMGNIYSRNNPIDQMPLFFYLEAFAV